MNNNTEAIGLSPIAQAIVNAALEKDYGQATPVLYRRLSAAFKTATDQLLPDEPKPTGMKPCGDSYSAQEIRRAQRMGIRNEFLSIAQEFDF